MFPSHQKSTGTAYTPTIAFLAVAFIFTPSVLIVSRPFGFVSVALAIASSAVCVAAAWIHWRRSSNLSIPTLELQMESRRAK